MSNEQLDYKLCSEDQITPAFEVLVGVNELILNYKPDSGKPLPLISFSYDVGMKKFTLLREYAIAESMHDQETPANQQPLAGMIAPNSRPEFESESLPDTTDDCSELAGEAPSLVPDEEVTANAFELIPQVELAGNAEQSIEDDVSSLEESPASEDNLVASEHVEAAAIDTALAEELIPSFNPLLFSQQAWSQEQIEWQHDEEELKALIARVQFWQSRAATLEAGLKIAHVDAQQVVASRRDALSLLPQQAQENLKGGQKGLDIIVLMLSRLTEVMKGVTEESHESVQLPSPFGSDNWEEHVHAYADEDTANRMMKRKLNELGNARYITITEMRGVAEKMRKRVLQSVEKKVLPIIDGIEDGQRHSIETIGKLKVTYVGDAIQLDYWYSGYDNLRNNVLLGMLENINIKPMEIACGDEIDYERHEPFDFIADATMANEVVKEVVRAGYIFDSADEGDAVLRAAQVIVVKNAVVPEVTT